MKAETRTIDAGKVKQLLRDQGRKQKWFTDQVGVIEVRVSVWFRTGNILCQWAMFQLPIVG